MTPPASGLVSSIQFSTGGCVDFVLMWVILGRKATRPAQQRCVLRPTQEGGVFEIEKPLHHPVEVSSPTLFSTT